MEGKKEGKETDRKGVGTALSLVFREGLSDKVTSEQNRGKKWDQAKANTGMRRSVPGREALYV